MEITGPEFIIKTNKCNIVEVQKKLLKMGYKWRSGDPSYTDDFRSFSEEIYLCLTGFTITWTEKSDYERLRGSGKLNTIEVDVEDIDKMFPMMSGL